MGCVYAKEAESLDEETNPRMFSVRNVDDLGHVLNPGNLEIGDSDLILYQKGKRVVHWPLRCLRRYGFDQEIFSFESGRRCLTGPGIFAFKCSRSEVLFNLVQESIQRCGAEDGHGGSVPVGTSGTVFLNPPVVESRPNHNSVVHSPSFHSRGGTLYGHHAQGNESQSWLMTDFQLHKCHRGTAPGNMVPMALSMSSSNGTQGNPVSHSYVNGAPGAAERALNSLTSGAPSTPASPSAFDGADHHSYVNTPLESGQAPPIDYAVLDLAPSNEDLDDCEMPMLTPLGYLPGGGGRGGGNGGCAIRHPSVVGDRSPGGTGSRRSMCQTQMALAADADYSVPSSRNVDSTVQQQQRARGTPSPSETTAAAFSSSSSPVVAASYANIASASQLSDQESNSDTTQTSGTSDRVATQRRVSLRSTSVKPKPAPLNIPDSVTGSSSTEMSESSTNPSPSPFRPQAPSRSDGLDSEWRCVYENVDHDGAPANWRYDSESLSPQMNYDQVPLPSKFNPAATPVAAANNSHRGGYNSAVPPPRPPITPKNLIGLPSAAPTIEYATLELEQSSVTAISQGILPKSPSTPLPLSSTPSSISSSSQLHAYHFPHHRLHGQPNGHAGVIGSRPSADMYSQIDIQRTEALRLAQMQRGAHRTRLNSAYGDACHKEHLANS